MLEHKSDTVVSKIILLSSIQTFLCPLFVTHKACSYEALPYIPALKCANVKTGKEIMERDIVCYVHSHIYVSC